jgi:hypothetical protein
MDIPVFVVTRTVRDHSGRACHIVEKVTDQRDRADRVANAVRGVVTESIAPYMRYARYPRVGGDYKDRGW